MITHAQRRVLLLIQLALLVSTFALAVIALVLRGRIDGPQDTTTLLYAVIAQSLFALVVVLVLRRMRARPRHAGQLAALTIIAWAVGESAAIVGAIAVLLGAPVWALLLGYAVFYLASRLNPVPQQ